MRFSIRLFLFTFNIVFFYLISFSSAMDGQTVAQMVFDRYNGEDSSSKVQMLLIDKRNKKRAMSLSVYSKDYGDLTKSITIFIAPASINGTAFLTWENKNRDDDQFLYLPALRRVRRIASKQKKNRFVNSDYFYEDLERRSVDKDTHIILKSEKYYNYNCWILESKPKDRSSTQYGKRLSWVIKDIYLVIKQEYYGKKGKLKKIFYAKKIKKIQGIWTVIESEMRDLKKKHRTLMRYSKLQYNKNIPDKIFTKGYLLHKK